MRKAAAIITGAVTAAAGLLGVSAPSSDAVSAPATHVSASAEHTAPALILAERPVDLVRHDAKRLASNYRCLSQHLDYDAWPDDTIGICWQYTYHAQADGTGIIATNLFMQLSQNCSGIDHITRMYVKAINPKTDAVNDSQDLAEINTGENCGPWNRSLSLTGRDVGNETLRWVKTFEHNFRFTEQPYQYNDCASLADPYNGVCDPV